mmetsp:Transcript_45600/g.145511  ORF Transcript_45600/g.145511 Transcript_45600/m.145511 type:complete len:171 (+) Transcript_45600:304-816(+)
MRYGRHGGSSDVSSGALFPKRRKRDATDVCLRVSALILFKAFFTVSTAQTSRLESCGLDALPSIDMVPLAQTSSGISALMFFEAAGTIPRPRRPCLGILVLKAVGMIPTTQTSMLGNFGLGALQGSWHDSQRPDAYVWECRSWFSPRQWTRPPSAGCPFSGSYVGSGLLW